MFSKSISEAIKIAKRQTFLRFLIKSDCSPKVSDIPLSLMRMENMARKDNTPRNQDMLSMILTMLCQDSESEYSGER